MPQQCEPALSLGCIHRRELRVGGVPSAIAQRGAERLALSASVTAALSAAAFPSAFARILNGCTACQGPASWAPTQHRRHNSVDSCVRNPIPRNGSQSALARVAGGPVQRPRRRLPGAGRLAAGRRSRAPSARVKRHQAVDALELPRPPASAHASIEPPSTPSGPRADSKRTADCVRTAAPATDPGGAAEGRAPRAAHLTL